MRRGIPQGLRSDFGVASFGAMNPTVPSALRAVLLLLLLATLPACRAENHAVAALRKKAEAGDAQAQAGLAWLYFSGETVEKDLAQAAKWYRKSAEQNDPVAQFNLGSMFAKGLGVERSEKEAAKWYRRAAEQGHAAAQANLGVLLANGEGVAKDDAEAVKWYRKAAEQGSSQGQLNLGVMYVSGRGVARDLVEAYKCWSLAAGQGEKDAPGYLELVTKLLTPEQLAEARRRVDAVAAKKSP